MIDLYYCATPNGLKLRLFIEEAPIPYRIIPVDLGKDEQFKPEFLAVCPIKLLISWDVAEEFS